MSTPSAHLFWKFPRADDKFMMDACFHEGIGPVFYMRLLDRRQALRVLPAETRLTVYGRCVVFWHRNETEWFILDLIIFP